MGLLKDSITKNKYQFLTKLGFKFGPNSGARGEYGYTKTFHHNGNETLWVTVSPINNKVYLYNEWDCGGMLWDREIDIPDNIMDNETEFVEWLDEQIGD